MKINRRVRNVLVPFCWTMFSAALLNIGFVIITRWYDAGVTLSSFFNREGYKYVSTVSVDTFFDFWWLYAIVFVTGMTANIVRER